MSYSKKTSYYQIPYMSRGDVLSSSDEETIAKMLDNLLRLGTLGGPYISKEGTYTTTINPNNSVIVNLTGNPAVMGCLAGTFLNIPALVYWTIPDFKFYYLYLRGDSNLILNPAAAIPVISTSEYNRDTYVLMATLDNTTPGNPILNTAPLNKPNYINLNRILNNPIDPFGSQLTQSNLTVQTKLTVSLATGQTVLIKQLVGNNSSPVITIQNSSDAPILKSTTDLTFADQRVTSVKLSDSTSPSLPHNSPSIFSAINKAVKTPITSISLGVLEDDGNFIYTNATAGSSFSVVLIGNRTLATPTNPSDGLRILWRFKQDVTGNRILTLSSGFRVPTSIGSIVLSTTGLKTDYLEAVYNADASKWDVIRFEKGC